MVEQRADLVFLGVSLLNMNHEEYERTSGKSVTITVPPSGRKTSAMRDATIPVPEPSSRTFRGCDFAVTKGGSKRQLFGGSTYVRSAYAASLKCDESQCEMSASCSEDPDHTLPAIPYFSIAASCESEEKTSPQFPSCSRGLMSRLGGKFGSCAMVARS